MTPYYSAGTGARLERSCGPPADWIKMAPPSDGIERFEAFFAGHAFAPHRHDTYAVGYTTHGVQAFRYRGASEHSLPGQAFALHPDELHDGRAGTEAGFAYRIAYVEPGLIGAALGRWGRALPFVRQAVSNDRRLAAAVGAALDSLDRPLDDLHRDQVLVALADAMAAGDPSLARRQPANWRAVTIARDMLDANILIGVTAAQLEAATGLTRFSVTRHFHACLGTSPHRYLLMRRLDRVRALIRHGTPLADAALASGFADQSHMTRHFKKAYGLTPRRWSAMVRTDRSVVSR